MRLLVLAGTVCLLAVVGTGDAAPAFPARTLDGSGNNVQHPDWGQGGHAVPAGRGPQRTPTASRSMSAGPPTRYVSNRIFNDVGQNLFSENGVSQWGWAWGQFLDHDFGLRDETPAESAPIAFDAGDPLEAFTNDFGAIGFNRTPAAPGHRRQLRPAQQINTISSFIDALERLRRRRESGSTGCATARSTATRRTTAPRCSCSPNGYLPRADARGNAATAPPMDLMGRSWRRPRGRRSPATSARTRTSRSPRPTRCSPASTTGSSRRSRRAALGRGEVPDRPPGRRSGDAVHHLQRVPARARRQARRYRGYDPRVNPSLGERVRDRRLPGAQHDPR